MGTIDFSFPAIGTATRFARSRSMFAAVGAVALLGALVWLALPQDDIYPISQEMEDIGNETSAPIAAGAAEVFVFSDPVTTAVTSDRLVPNPDIIDRRIEAAFRASEIR